MNGLFITFEGTEGSGKTSVIKGVEQYLKEAGYDVLVTREPGGIKISEQIRNIILDKDNTEMDPITEALLFAASRRQHLIERIFPAVAQNKIVLCDRYLDSSLVYQGIARKIGLERVNELNQLATEGFLPVLTVFIDVPPHIGLERVFAARKIQDVNRLDLEKLEFHTMIYNGYKSLLDRYPERFKSIDGTKPLKEVIEDALNLIKTLL